MNAAAGEQRGVRAIVTDAVNRFLANDNWAIASDIALAILLSLFPFLIILTAVASLIGSEDLAREAADLILASNRNGRDAGPD